MRTGRALYSNKKGRRAAHHRALSRTLVGALRPEGAC